VDITLITEAIRQNPVWVIFANVFLQQLGLPVPAVPTLLVAGSLAGSSGQAVPMLAVAVLASVIADWIWYLAGRAFGYRVLSGLCRLSINPGSCVSETEARFVRWGVWSLVIAKFVPGVSIVAPPIAGSLRMSLPSFIAASGIGAAAWAGAAILAGWLLRAEVKTALDLTGSHETAAVAAIALGLCAWLAWKLWQKHRFERLAAIPHNTPGELMAAMRSDAPPLLLDLRGDALIAQKGSIEGATQAHLDDLPKAVNHWPKHGHIVTLCACPEDAAAVRAARSLTKLGYTSVRPLKGGYESWIRHLEQYGP
jgi:membrane protein DedA with SNARE-associated domain/rhodanese-related sulfurtransferase